jgi:hypothetical protein
VSAGIDSLLEAATALGRFGAPWWFAGGWAIDLHLGRVTREHHDVDVAVLRRDQHLLHRALDGFTLRKVIPHPEGLLDQGTLAPWPAGEELELPIHQIAVMRARSMMRPQTEDVIFRVMLQETRADTWLYRRDPAVTRPLAALGAHPLWGFPYLAPEVVLLYKAKHCLARDRADFDLAVGALSAEARAWLKSALERVHPGHRWIARI